MIRCLTCGYSLQGDRAGICPECGRAFDPREPAHQAQALGLPRWYHCGAAVLVGWPLLVLAVLNAAYVMVRPRSAGHAPWESGALEFLLLALGLISPLVLLAIPALLLWGDGHLIWRRTPRGWGWALKYGALAVAAWGLAVMWVLRDPSGLVGWLLRD